MTDINSRNFGLLIAFVLPGLMTLIGIAQFSDVVQNWLGTGGPESATVGGFLYVTLASVAAGLVVSTLRWLVLDWIHHQTGIRQPQWDFSLLQEKAVAFDVLVEVHYRYYQFYGNMLMALAITSGAMLVRAESWNDAGWIVLIFGGTAAVLFLGSRDTLAKYYSRTEQLLAATGRNGDELTRLPPRARNGHRPIAAAITEQSSSRAVDSMEIPR